MEFPDPPDVSSDDAGLSIVHDVSSVKLLCDPCKEDGYSYDAEGYCVDCIHHLCQTCLQHHRTPRPMRHHNLLDKHEMPQQKPDKVFKNECTDKCSVHGDEILKYFCQDHKIFGCTVCVTLEHRTCKVGYIPTLSADLFNTEEYKSFKSALETMVRNTKSIRETATRSLEDSKKSAEAVFVKIRNFRKEIDTFFDELEKEISSKMTQIRDENEETITEILKKSKIMADKLMDIEKVIKDKEDKLQKCRLFFDMKQLDETMCELQKDIDMMGKNTKIQELLFKPSNSVMSFIQNKSETFGSLVCFHESIQLDFDGHFVDDIAVSSRGRIAIQCFHSNPPTKRTVSIDTQQTPAKVLTQLDSSMLSGLTRFSENEIAVEQNGNIQIYSVTDKYILKNTIQNTKIYHAIVYTNDLFIGCTLNKPYKLRIVNMNGDVLKTLPIELVGEGYRPCYIAVHPHHNTIYVTDVGEKALICLTVDSEVKREYKPGSDWEPRGVAISSDGLVYVSDSKNNNIYILTSDLKPYDVIIGTKHGICGPRGLAVCNRERKLYVGMDTCKSISVFNI